MQKDSEGTYVHTYKDGGECAGWPRVNAKGGGDRRKGSGNPAIIYTKNSTFHCIQSL